MSWQPAKKPSRLPEWMPLWLKDLSIALFKCGLAASFLLVAVAIFYLYLAAQYDIKDVAKLPERSLIFDKNDQEIGSIHSERRRLISRDEIPDHLVKALYAREDARFLDHHGVDVKGLIRATLRNIKDRSFTQGASTLTMQLTRNSFELRAKSLHRKFLEISLTLRLEKRYSKDEIVTHYLNRIYFGSGCHGVEEAAQTYFGRPAVELNEAESALLMGIIRGPNIFSPFRNIKRAKDQQEEVFARMLAAGYITQEELDTKIKQPLRLVPKEQRSSSRSYAKELTRKHLNIILEKHEIRDGGLRIYTTIDQAMQTRCEKALIQPLSGLPDEEKVQSAIVKLDATTGSVLAICGGRDFTKSAYNRAYSTKRDLGSMFEPFLYALALERNKVGLKGEPLQTGRQLGDQETARLAQRLGFSGRFLEGDDLYRGGVAATAMELAVATATISNQGKKPAPYFISRITDAHGKVLYRNKADTKQAISKSSSSDTYSTYKEMKYPASIVTSTNSCRNVWGIQTNKNVVTTIWLGHDSSIKIGEKESAIDTVKSLFKKLD